MCISLLCLISEPYIEREGILISGYRPQKNRLESRFSLFDLLGA